MKNSLENPKGYKTDHSIEFLLKEYDRIHTLWMDEGHQAEQRVNFFLTIASAAIGALIIFPQLVNLSSTTLTLAAIGVLGILLLLGINVLNRLNLRTVQQRAFRKSLSEIHNYFASQDKEIGEYIERQKRIYFVPSHKNSFSRFIQNNFTGGLNDLMIVCNALIIGGLILILLTYFGFTPIFIFIGTLLTTILAERLLHIYINFVVTKLRPWLYY